LLIHSITQAIGNTPLLVIPPGFHGLPGVEIHAKLEHLNPWGSVKDRTGFNLLKDELERIATQRMRVIESTSGRTGIAFQLLCAQHGIPFDIVTNRIHVPEIMELLRLFGANILEMPGLSSCPDPRDPDSPLAYIDRLMGASPDSYVHPSQYTNERNYEAHQRTTGPEIFADGGEMDFFFGGLGTSGSTRGAGQFLKEQNPDTKLIGIVSRAGEVLPGMRSADEMYEVGIFQHSIYDRIVEVSRDAAIDAMLRMNRELGVLCGPSSGASYAAMHEFMAGVPVTEGEVLKVCFIVCDRVEPYLSFLKRVRPALFQQSAPQDVLSTLTREDLEDITCLSVDQVEARLAEFFIVDMCGQIAYKAGHLPGAVNFPETVLHGLIQSGLPFPRGRRLLFVCPTGVISRKYAAHCQAHGFGCASMQGGLTAWLNAGKPTESGTASPTC
jgi:cysteine synthase B